MSVPSDSAIHYWSTAVVDPPTRPQLLRGGRRECAGAQVRRLPLPVALPCVGGNGVIRHIESPHNVWPCPRRHAWTA
jgi:hypothetical protein